MTNFQPNQCELVWKINSNNEKKTRINIFYCVIVPKHSVKIKTLVIGKNFDLKLFSKTGNWDISQREELTEFGQKLLL